MKSYSLFLTFAGLTLVAGMTSCSQRAGSPDSETAEAVANGTMPPWMAEYSNQEVGSYVSDSPSHAYNPPAKPSVGKTSSSKTSKSTASSKSTKKTTAKKTTKKAPAPKSYIVKRGDTLGAIARRNGTTVSALKRTNGLKSDMIRIGQKLSIPR